MINQTTALLHFHKRQTQNQEAVSQADKFKKFYDSFIYLAVIMAPLANIPQLLSVWVQKNVSGVSPLSWFLFAVGSVIWFVYGILHKDKHIIIMNGALVVLQTVIAVGALIFR